MVPSHVEQARTGQPPVEAEVGDARELAEDDDAYDATLAEVAAAGPLADPTYDAALDLARLHSAEPP